MLCLSIKAVISREYLEGVFLDEPYEFVKNVTNNVWLGMHFMDPWLVMGLSQGIVGITGQTTHPSYSPDPDAHGDALRV